jgi:hypothetical protein
VKHFDNVVRLKKHVNAVQKSVNFYVKVEQDLDLVKGVLKQLRQVQVPGQLEVELELELEL